MTAMTPSSGVRSNSAFPAMTTGRQLAPLTEGRGALGLFDKDVNLVVTTLANAIVRQTISVEEGLRAKAKEEEAMREALRAALSDPAVMGAQPASTNCEGIAVDALYDTQGEVVGTSASDLQDIAEATDLEDEPQHPSVSSSSFCFSPVNAATAIHPVSASVGRPTSWPASVAGDLEASSAESPQMPVEGGGCTTAEHDLVSGSCAELQAERSSSAALEASLAGVFLSGVESIDWVSVVQDAYMLEPEELLRQQKTLKVAEPEPEEDSKADINDDDGAAREVAGWLMSDVGVAGSGGGHMQWDDITEEEEEEEDVMFVKRRRHSIWH